MDKLIELIKWCDSFKKVISIIVVGILFFGGYLAYKNEQHIWMMLSKDSNMTIKNPNDFENQTKQLLIDIEALALVVHEGDLMENKRHTILAQEANGTRNKNIEGALGSLFNSGSNKRNDALIAMLRGEVFCAPFKSSSKVGKWMDTLGVKYMCRVAVPAASGHFHGYMAIGFKGEPKNIVDVKQRIVLTSNELVK